jgi:acetylornithine deacetylase/succinyl-diaminopimelate desuccinylase-like protein
MRANHPVCQLLTMELGAAFEHVFDVLSELNYEVHTDFDHYIFGVPAGAVSPVMLVAHLDTLVPKDRQTGMHLKPVELVLQHDVLTNANGVLGADDRAGVYAVLEAARQATVKPLVLFTNYEEVGGLGVKRFIADGLLVPYVAQLRLFIEPDRKGFDEYVFYSWTLPSEVSAFVERFGFNADHGSYSDVKDLTEAYRVPHVNLSVGYLNQHSKDERLNLTALDRTVGCLADMLAAAETLPLTRVPDAPPMRSFGTGLHQIYDWGGTGKRKRGKAAAIIEEEADVFDDTWLMQRDRFDAFAAVDPLDHLGPEAFEMALWLCDDGFDAECFAELNDEDVLQVFWQATSDVELDQLEAAGRQPLTPTLRAALGLVVQDPAWSSRV